MDYKQWKKEFFDSFSGDESVLLNAYESSLKPISAVYAISADPPTWGHADIMMRAAKKFDKVYWVIGINPNKTGMFSTAQKIEMMEIYLKHYKLDNVIIQSVEGSIAKYAQQQNAAFLIRGLRSSSDYQMEFELSVGNRGINKELETVCMFTKPHYATISSSIVREIALLGENISQYVHPRVESLIKNTIK